jgi:pimeloyl-ACP methyl ester carboxylesterase
MPTDGAAAADAGLRPPGLLELALEARAPFEYGAAIAAMPLLRRAPRGDGHPVLVLPGLGASDRSTAPLRRFLGELGYAAHAWQLGRNLGPSRGAIEHCLVRIHDLQRRSGRRVSLVGWSLGGIYARELAKRAPASVRCVITLGAPFAGHPRATNAWRAFELVNGRRHHAPEHLDALRQSPPVPTTSIWSRTDGIVAWRCSVEREGSHTENIEVDASHIGMGVHPAVLYAIADRLAQAEGRWERFSRHGWRRLIYPDPRGGSRFRAAPPTPEAG